MKLISRLSVALAVLFLLGTLAGPALAQDKRDITDRIEISFFLGGSRGQVFGAPSLRCTSAAPSSSLANGCDPTLMSEAAAFSDSVFSDFGFGGSSPNFMINSALEPRQGPNAGARFGVDLNPRWQIEFLYAYSAAHLNFNPDARDAIAKLAQECAGTTECTEEENNVGVFDGDKGQGNQQLYLFNANYHFNENKRVVPYVGLGLGWERWYNGQNFHVMLEDDGDFIDMRKSSGNSTAFALDFAGGVKIHATRHFGLRLELMNLVSFPRFSNSFQTIDVTGEEFNPGDIVSPSGTSRQKSAFNQVIFTAGIFWRF